MGISFVDAYSPSHFFGGLTFYLLGINWLWALILHTAFEIFENYYWMGVGGYCFKIPFILPHRDCKTKPDSELNILGDTVFFMAGLFTGLYLLPKYQPGATWNWGIKLFIIGLVIPLGYSLLTTNILYLFGGRLPDYEHDSNSQLLQQTH